ncbi:MAG: hypothetical protein CSA97_06075 [Bacteroidetes bacterium]|nr:MAG: hypothetical protein CSA97_06075 [Bacteroidota bacterium]
MTLAFVGALALGSCEKDKVVEDPVPVPPEQAGSTNPGGTNNDEPEDTNKKKGPPSQDPGTSTPSPSPTPGAEGESTAPDGRVWYVDLQWKAESVDRYEAVDLWEVKHKPESVSLESLKDVVKFEVYTGSERKEIGYDELTLKKLRWEDNYLYFNIQYKGVTSTNRRLAFDVEKYFGYLVSVDPEGPKKLYLNGAYHFASNEMGWLFQFDRTRPDGKKRVQFHRAAPVFEKDYDHSSGTLSLTFWVEDPRDENKPDPLLVQITKSRVSGFKKDAELVKDLTISPSPEFIEVVKANRAKNVELISNAIATGKAKMLVDIGGGKTEMRDFQNLWASCTYQLGDKPLEPRLNVEGQKFVLYRAEKYLDVYMVNPKFVVTEKMEKVDAGGKQVLELKVRLAEFYYDRKYSPVAEVPGDATTTVVVPLD